MTIASTSYKTCFQYVGVSFTQLINENAGRLAANLLIVPLRLFLVVPAHVQICQKRYNLHLMQSIH